jgi:dipeptidyl aminopeptidase/acylaminoacyl peptidase
LQLWVIDLHSGLGEQVTHLESGINPDPATIVRAGHPGKYSWSPDGSRLAFASQVAEPSTENEAEHEVPAAGKGPRPLVLTGRTPPDWTLVGLFDASKLRAPWDIRENGNPQTATLPQRRISQLFLVNVNTGILRQLTFDKNGYFNPDWSPKGEFIACASSEGKSLAGFPDIPTNIYLVDVGGQESIALTSDSGDKYYPSWSPDGDWVAYKGGKHFGKESVFVIARTGGRPVEATARLDASVNEFRWLPDSKAIVAIVLNGVSWPVVRIEWSTGRLQNVADKGRAHDLTASSTGDIAWVHSDGATPGLIKVWSARAQQLRIVNNLNPQVGGRALGEQEVVIWKNSRGEDLEGVLIKPTNYQSGRRYPLIVDGYPMQTNSFKGNPMTGNQAWASNGYAVFWPNPRSPHLWWNQFRTQAFDFEGRGPEGWDVAVDDVLSGVNELIRRGLVDPERMGLYGFSNGGAVINYLVTRTKRFKCAISVSPALSDWIRPALLHSESLVSTFEGGLDPWNNPEDYIRLSAVFHVNKVTTPMLLADGDNDGDFLLDSIEMYNGLRWFGKEVVLLRYPDQGHGFTGWALRDFWERESAFFDEHLKPSATLQLR